MQIHCKFDQLLDPRSLKPRPKNRNSHSKEQIERLGKLYEFHGIRHPIIVSNLSGHIVAGHGRREAAVRAKIKEFPVVFQDFTDDVAEYAFIQADNAIALWAELDLSGINSDIGELGPDFDLDLLGIKNFTLDASEKLEPGCDEDEVPEAKPEAKVVRGEVYILGNHRLMCGSSTVMTDMDRLTEKKIPDLIYTDPPYGMSAVTKSGVLSKRYKTDIIGDEGTSTAKDAFNLSIGMYPESDQVWWGANYYCSGLPDSECWIVWDKNNGQSDQTDCELAWTNFRAVVRQYTKASEKKDRVHPTQKPVSLFDFVLERFKIQPKLVIDQFGGSGSTMIACEKNGIASLTMELDPLFCGVILDRWQRFTGKKAHREDGVAWDEIRGAK